MRALEFITGHVIFKLRYDQIYQMKTNMINFEPKLAIPTIVGCGGSPAI